MEQYRDVDLLYLPALWRDPIPVLKQHPQMVPLLQEAASRQALICAVGTSSCFVAKAGLLDGKPATTPWVFMEAFSRRSPKVQLKRQHLTEGSYRDMGHFSTVFRKHMAQSPTEYRTSVQGERGHEKIIR